MSQNVISSENLFHPDNFQLLKKLPYSIKQQFQINKMPNIKEEDEDFICRVLLQILKYPDKNLAQIHKLSNRLGSYDLKQLTQNKQKESGNNNKKQQYNESKENIFEITQESMFANQKSSTLKKEKQFCHCCGFVRQDDNVSLCEDFTEFPNIGLSTFLYFGTLKNITILITILLVLYSCFSLIVNYLLFANSKGSSFFDGFSLISSFYNIIFSFKSINDRYYIQYQTISIFLTIESFIILGIVLIWSFTVYLFRHYEIQAQDMIDDHSFTASDFSIMIENVPIQLVKEKEYISQQFDDYFKSIFPYVKKQYFSKYLNQPNDKTKNNKLSEEDEAKKFKVEKSNVGVPFYLSEKQMEENQNFKQLQSQLEQHKQKLIQWMQQFFQEGKLTVKIQRRQKRLNEYLQVGKKVAQIKQEQIQKLKNEVNLTHSDQLLTTIFVTFSSALAAKVVYELNPNDLRSKLKYFFSCCNDQYRFNLKNYKGKIVPTKISRAPEPEDIIWQNIGFSFCRIAMKRLLTFIVTGGILIGSFFLMTYLSDIQLHTNNSFISIVISLSISIINVAIGLVIRKLTAFQKDFTETNHQTSLAIKSILAQLINSIVLPIMVKLDNLYGQKGLVEDVFFMAITNAFVAPTLKILDFSYFFSRIKYWYKSKPYNRIGMKQQQLNEYAELSLFEIGYEYIYIVNAFLFTCFYTPLQPIIPFISILGLFMMYWAQKYTLLNRLKRPIPGSNTINIAVSQIIYLGSSLLASGLLIFSDILTTHDQKGFHFLIHLISIGLGIFFYLLPFDTIYRIIFSDDEYFQNLDYFLNRMILPSQYDRLNPATSQQGVEDFKKYLKQLKDKIMNRNSQNEDQSQDKIYSNLTGLFEKINKNGGNINNNLIKKEQQNNNEQDIFSNFQELKNLAKAPKKSKDNLKSINKQSPFENLLKPDFPKQIETNKQPVKQKLNQNLKKKNIKNTFENKPAEEYLRPRKSLFQNLDDNEEQYNFPKQIRDYEPFLPFNDELVDEKPYVPERPEIKKYRINEKKEQRPYQKVFSNPVEHPPKLFLEQTPSFDKKEENLRDFYDIEPQELDQPINRKRRKKQTGKFDLSRFNQKKQSRQQNIIELSSPPQQKKQVPSSIQPHFPTINYPRIKVPMKKPLIIEQQAKQVKQERQEQVKKEKSKLYGRKMRRQERIEEKQKQQKGEGIFKGYYVNGNKQQHRF